MPKQNASVPMVNSQGVCSPKNELEEFDIPRALSNITVFAAPRRGHRRGSDGGCRWVVTVFDDAIVSRGSMSGGQARTSSERRANEHTLRSWPPPRQ